MNPVSKDIKDLLVTAGLGGDAGVDDWAIYRGQEQTVPFNTITVYDTGGPLPGYFYDVTVAETQYPTFQIRVRGVDYDTAYAKMEAIKDYLNTVTGWFVTVGAERTEYGRPFQTSEIFSLGKDEGGRSLFTINFKIIRQDVS